LCFYCECSRELEVKEAKDLLALVSEQALQEVLQASSTDENLTCH